MQRQSFLREENQSDEVHGYSQSNYEMLSEWYRQATTNFYSTQTNNLTIAYNNRYHLCRLTIKCLSYLKTAFPQLENGQYELQVFANFSFKDTLICRPYQSQPLGCVYDKNKLVTKSPIVLYYHSPQYRDLIIFLEYQLLVADSGPIRLGYCTLHPFQQNSYEKETQILLGWPFDNKNKSVVLGSCLYSTEISTKILNNLQHLLPPLTIVDSNTRIPCCKGGKFPTDKQIEMDPSTTIFIDMVHIESSQFLGLEQQLQNLSEKRSKLEAKSIKAIFQCYQLQVGLHNTWTVVGQSIIRPLNLHSHNLVDPGAPIAITIYNSKPICLIGTLSCRYKIDINSDNFKKVEKKSHLLCWFMFPLDLFKQVNLISILGLHTPIFDINSFHCKKPVKLTCRIKHPNFMNYRQTFESRQNSSQDMAKIFQKSQIKTSKWKTIYRTDRGNAIQDIQIQNKKILREQQKFEKELSTKLYKPYMIPSGKKTFIQDLGFALIPIEPSKIIGKVIVAHLKLESFLPYFKNLRNNYSFDFYFVPRSIQIRFYILNKVFESKKLIIADSPKIGMLSILTRADFKQGKSAEASEVIKFEIDVKNKKIVDRINKNNLIAVVYDAQSRLVYAQSRIPLVKLIQIGSNKRSRLQLIEKNDSQNRGAICVDVHSALKNGNSNISISEEPLSNNLIAHHLSDKARIQSRIDNYKQNKKLTSTNQELLKAKQQELELLKQYKESKIKKFARKTAETNTFQNLDKIECQSCTPSFYIWEYTNNQGSLNNDYKLVIEDSDASILAVEEMHLVRTLSQFEEACKILNTQPKNFIQADYKNQFYLKNGEKAKLILKFLTYRVPHSNKDIQPHRIKLNLLRNTIPCSEKEVFIQPNPPDVNNVFVFYQILSDIIELEFEQMFSIRYINSYILPIFRGSVSKWVKNKLVISINCQSRGILEFMMVIYKDKTRLQVLNISKVIVYAYQGILKNLKLGESYQYSFRLSNPKFGIVRLETTHPNLVVFENPIVSVSSQETVHMLNVFPQILGNQVIMISAVEYQTSNVIAMFVISLNITQMQNIERLHHEVKPLHQVRDAISIQNTQKVQQLFRIKCTSSQVKFENYQIQVGARTSRRIRFQVQPQQNEDCFRAYIFVYSVSNLLLKSYELEIIYSSPLLDMSN